MMKAGLFLCDHVKPELQAEFGDYTDMYAEIFPEFSFCYYDVCNGVFPEDINECDFYMATGSRHSVYDDLPWIKQLKSTVKQLHKKKKPFVGFCFGHQLIAEALGGKVAPSPNGWCVGVHSFEWQNMQHWMRPVASDYNLLMMCQDQVQKLPKNAKVLAGNDQCPVGMFQVGNHTLGIQAHPEFPKAYDQVLMEERVERIGEDKTKAGIKSLSRKVHTKLIHDWVVNFVKK